MYLETLRCLIRPFSLDDAEALHITLSDPEVMRFIELPFDLLKTQAFILDAGLCTPPLIHALIWKQTRMVIGHVIFHPYPDGGYEIGWILRKSHWRMGIASEVTEALLAHAREHGISSCVIECHPLQDATRHIAGKHGFTLEEETDECLIFRHTF